MKYWGFLASLIAVFLQSACVNSPKRVEPEGLASMPEGWHQAETIAEASGLWWEAFVSDELQGFLEEAFAGNPDYQAMSARLEAADASTRIAGAGLFPSVSAGFNGARQKQNFIGFPIPGSSSDVLSTQATTYGLSLSSVWEIDVWGRVRAGKRAALAEQEAAAAEMAMQRLSLAAQVSKAWVTALAAQQQVQLAQKSAESFASTAERIGERYAQGLRTSLELQLAANSAETAGALVAERQLQSVQAVQVLQQLLGRYPSGNMVLGAGLPEVQGALVSGIPSRLLVRRPDLLAAERRLAAADQRVWESRAALFPQISLTGSTGTTSSELEDLLDSDFSVWALAGNLAQPLLQGGRLRAGVDLSKARRKEAVFNYLSSVWQAFREVEFGLASESLLRQREGFVLAGARQSESALALAERQYRSGLIDLITVLEAQRRSLADATQVIILRQARLANRIDLFLALGGGASDRVAE